MSPYLRKKRKEIRLKKILDKLIKKNTNKKQKNQIKNKDVKEIKTGSDGIQKGNSLHSSLKLLENLEDMQHKFLELYNLPKLNKKDR